MVKNPSIIIESIVIGSSAKVTAIDVNTKLEATIIGDSKLPKKQLENLAIKKLKYVIDKKS